MSFALLKKHILIILGLLGIWAVALISGLPCPIAYLTGCVCPACGCTRAILALLQGNVEAYLRYQPMALPLVVAVVLCFHLRAIKKPFKGMAVTVVGLILLVNTALYVNRLTTVYFG